MNQSKTIIGVTLTCAVLLALMGCWFFWHRQSRPSDLQFGEFGLEAKRGSILAADGTSLAYTARAWRFYLDPAVMVHNSLDPDRFAKDVAEGLGLDVERVTELCRSGKSRYLLLCEVEDGSPSNVWYARNSGLVKKGGIIRKPVQRRIYPLGAAAAAVVGFMHDEPDTKPKGAGGLEAACDMSLRGEDGAYDKSLPADVRREKATPRPGEDVCTTIVPKMQKAVFKALADASATNGAESAWGLVMKVPSGEIAAMASWPTFDPHMRRTLEKWSPSMAVNHAAQSVFEPGGLAKPLTYAAALDVGALAEDARLDQGGGTWEYNGVTFKDDVTNELSIAEAMERHVNIAAGKTACLIGPEKLHAALLRFGFGAKTCVVGVPGESSGLVSSKSERWRIDKTTAARVGMGYGFAATGLQVAQAYATLANHGTLVRPVLVKGAGTNTASQAVSPAAADAIARALRSPMPSTVQMFEGGIDRNAYSPTNYIASCAGFAASADERYVVAVSFTKPHPAHSGDEVARPAWISIANVLKQE